MCAGIPRSPALQSSVCHYYRSNGSVTVQIGMPNSNDTDLDYFKIELFRDGSLLGTNLEKILNNTVIYATIFPNLGRLNDVYVNVTAFDKCRQQSPQPLTLPCDVIPIGNTIHIIFIVL